MQTRFFLIRHGMCDPVGVKLSGQMPGVHLNEEGRKQSIQLAPRVRVDALYSSPLSRALETAEPISLKLGIDVQVSSAATDIDFGDWTGADLADLKTDDRWARFNQFRSFTRVPHGESMIEVQGRILAEIERLSRTHGGESVALVTHADIIKSVLAFALGMNLDSILRMEISPASISRLEWTEWGVRVLGMNDTSHLSGAA